MASKGERREEKGEKKKERRKRREEKLEFIHNHPCPDEIRYLTLGKHITDGDIRGDDKKVPPNVRWLKLGMWSSKKKASFAEENPSFVWPSRLETLHVFSHGWELSCAAMPRTLKALSWWYPPEQLQLAQLPQGLLELDLQSQYWNQSLTRLPPGLLKLSVGYWNFNENVAGKLPSTLQFLKLKGEFNWPLDPLPPTLKVCKIRSKQFNQPIDELPDSLQTLELGSGFKCPVGKWPASLTHLDCTSPTWQVVECAPLPDLVTLTIACPVLPPLPFSLRELTIYSSRSSSSSEPRILHHLPPRLEKLKIRDVDLLIDAWPEPLTHIDVDEGLQSLPPWPLGLVRLEFDSFFTRDTAQEIKLPTLPGTLCSLTLRGNMHVNLPPRLRRLVWFSCEHKKLLELPPLLDSLDLRGYEGPLVLPPCLRDLCIAGDFDRPLQFPEFMQKLHIIGKWNQPLNLEYGMGWVDLRSSQFNCEITGPAPRTLRLPHSFKGVLPWDLPLPKTHGNRVMVGKCHPQAEELKGKVELDSCSTYDNCSPDKPTY